MTTPAPTRRPTVLMVDNNVELLNESKTRLERAGYHVLTATTPDEALKIVSDRWLHLVVIDTRLRNDVDRADLSGIVLARDERMRIHPRVLWTGFRIDTLDDVTQKFGHGNIPDGIRIQPKQEDIVTIVDNAFRPEHAGGWGMVQINFAQKLNYIDPPSALSLVDLLKDPPRDGDAIIARMGEIEDLFGKGFPESEMLTLLRLPQGRGSSFVLIVTPYVNGEIRRARIAKCAHKVAISEEYKRYQEHVEPFLYRAGVIRREPVTTLKLGLLTYQITDGEIEKTSTFAEYYRWQPAEYITRAVRDLFSETLRPWYQGAISEEAEPLRRFYERRLLFGEEGGIDREILWRQIHAEIQRALGAAKGVGVRVQAKRLLWRTAGREIDCPEPHDYLSRLESGSGKLFGPSYHACRCHGDLHAENIRVNDDPASWVIDFEHTGFGPVLQDAVELESSIHFGLIQEHQYERLFQFELALASQQDLGERLEFPAELTGQDDTGELRKAFDVITFLRGEASAIGGARIADYYLGLVFHALRMIRAWRSPSWAGSRPASFYKTQALFVASIYCRELERLGERHGQRPKTVL
jgi:CheY-like chemotaxis protein